MSSPKIEGWLIKKRGDYHKNKFLGKDNMRWFKLQEVTGTDQAELALCYFKTQKEKEPKGWIFVKDINEIRDNHNSFTVISPARTMTIECQTPHEQFLWLKHLLECCHNADISRVLSISKDFLKSRKSLSSYKDCKEESKTSFDRTSSVFSRNADDIDESSLLDTRKEPITGRRGVVDMSNEDNENIPNSSNQQHINEDDESYGGAVIEEHETLKELADLHSNQKQQIPHQPSKTIKNTTGRANNNHKEDLRNIRNSGNLGVTTSNRLSKHIARDGSPLIVDRINNNNHHQHINNQEYQADLQHEAKSDTMIALPYNVDKNFKTTKHSINEDEKDVEDIHLESDQVLKNRARLRERRQRSNRTTHRRIEDYSSDELDSSRSDSDKGSDRNDLHRLAANTAHSHREDKDSIESGPVAIRRVKDIIDDEDEISRNSLNKQRVSIDDLLKRGSITTIADSKLDDSRSDEEVDFKAELRKYNVQPALNIESKDCNSVIGGTSPRSCNCSNIYRMCECTNISRPPRPPSGAPPYNLSLAANVSTSSSLAMTQSGNNNISNKEPALSKFRVATGSRSYTPPRKSADPGSKVDDNFVSEDWDEDADVSKYHHNRIAEKKDNRGSSYTATNSTNSNYSNMINRNQGLVVSAATTNIKRQPTSVRNTVYGKGIEADVNWLQEDFDD